MGERLLSKERRKQVSFFKMLTYISNISERSVDDVHAVQRHTQPACGT